MSFKNSAVKTELSVPSAPTHCCFVVNVKSSSSESSGLIYIYTQGIGERINFRSDRDRIFFCDQNDLFLSVIFLVIEERDRIIFYVIVIENFDHFPDHTYIHTILAKVQKS